MNNQKEKNNDSFFSLLHKAINPYISSPSKPQRPPNRDDYSEKQKNDNNKSRLPSSTGEI